MAGWYCSCWKVWVAAGQPVSPPGGGSQLLGPLRRAAPRGVEWLAGAERLGWSAQRESAQPAASAHPNRANMLETKEFRFVQIEWCILSCHVFCET